MPTRYNAFKGDMDNLELFLLNHLHHIDRLSFDTSWRWIGQGQNAQYISTFTVDLYDDEIMNEYIIENNQDFFKSYIIQKNIGIWQGNLFNELQKIIEKENMPHGSCLAINMDNGCFRYEKGMNREQAIKLTKLIETNLAVKTRLQQIGRGDYAIHIHSQQSVLDNLNIEDVKPVNKRKSTKKSTDLETEEQRLLKELKRVREKMKNQSKAK